LGGAGCLHHRSKLLLVIVTRGIVGAQAPGFAIPTSALATEIRLPGCQSHGPTASLLDLNLEVGFRLDQGSCGQNAALDILKNSLFKNKFSNPFKKLPSVLFFKKYLNHI